MQHQNPKIPLWLYHENSYDTKNFNEKINLEGLPSNWKELDLFKCWGGTEKLKNGWLEEFVDKDDSPFKNAESSKCAGWNIQAKYWFRKVAAYYHASKTCKTRYLLWLDCDIHTKKIDSIFSDFIEKYDLCFIERPKRQCGQHPPLKGSPPDTGVICFDLQNQEVLNFIKEIFDLFVNEVIFKESRWDDTWAFAIAYNKYAEKLNAGVFNSKFADQQAKNLSKFDIFNQFRHIKNNQKARLLPEEWEFFQTL